MPYDPLVGFVPKLSPFGPSSLDLMFPLDFLFHPLQKHTDRLIEPAWRLHKQQVFTHNCACPAAGSTLPVLAGIPDKSTLTLPTTALPATYQIRGRHFILWD